MNFHVGDDDLTFDKDFKHIFKRWRNLLIRPLRGVVINGHRITPDMTMDQLRSVGLSPNHIRALFNPEDQQDVKLAFDMLKDIWTLPRTSTNQNRGFLEAREALWNLGKLLYHMFFPYLCVDLSVSEQLEHLSATAHLALTLYKLASTDFIPKNLYIDLMIMIKNVFVCVAKAKLDDPNGEFFLILQGTDRLEELFGILRTMVRNDANLDVLQLVSRLAGSTDRLKRVQDISRFVKDISNGGQSVTPLAAESSEIFVLSDPIVTLVRIENQFWLCLGEVNAVRIDGQPASYVSFDMLGEDTVAISYQMMGLRPTTLDDDPEGIHDWRTCSIGEQTFTVPGRLIQSINPTLSKTHTRIPFYLLQSSVLVALTASLFQTLTISNLKKVPNFVPTKEYPYRKASGKLLITSIL